MGVDCLFYLGSIAELLDFFLHAFFQGVLAPYNITEAQLLNEHRDMYLCSTHPRWGCLCLVSRRPLRKSLVRLDFAFPTLCGAV